MLYSNSVPSFDLRVVDPDRPVAGYGFHMVGPGRPVPAFGPLGLNVYFFGPAGCSINTVY